MLQLSCCARSHFEATCSVSVSTIATRRGWLTVSWCDGSTGPGSGIGAVEHLVDAIVGIGAAHVARHARAVRRCSKRTCSSSRGCAPRSTILAQNVVGRALDSYTQLSTIALGNVVDVKMLLELLMRREKYFGKRLLRQDTLDHGPHAGMHPAIVENVDSTDHAGDVVLEQVQQERQELQLEVGHATRGEIDRYGGLEHGFAFCAARCGGVLLVLIRIDAGAVEVGDISTHHLHTCDNVLFELIKRVIRRPFDTSQVDDAARSSVKIGKLAVDPEQRWIGRRWSDVERIQGRERQEVQIGPHTPEHGSIEKGDGLFVVVPGASVESKEIGKVGQVEEHACFALIVKLEFGSYMVYNLVLCELVKLFDGRVVRLILGDEIEMLFVDGASVFAFELLH